MMERITISCGAMTEVPTSSSTPTTLKIATLIGSLIHGIADDVVILTAIDNRRCLIYDRTEVVSFLNPKHPNISDYRELY
jgi:hypothetical protein